MVIFVSGSINSGNTTVSELLAKRIPACALVEQDQSPKHDPEEETGNA